MCCAVARLRHPPPAPALDRRDDRRESRDQRRHQQNEIPEPLPSHAPLDFRLKLGAGNSHLVTQRSASSRATARHRSPNDAQIVGREEPQILAEALSISHSFLRRASTNDRSPFVVRNEQPAHDPPCAGRAQAAIFAACAGVRRPCAARAQVVRRNVRSSVRSVRRAYECPALRTNAGEGSFVASFEVDHRLVLDANPPGGDERRLGRAEVPGSLAGAPAVSLASGRSINPRR